MPTAVNAGARLDRLPISSFHHRIFWLIGAGMFFDGYDLYVGTTVLGATLQSKFSTLAQNAQFISLTFLGMTIGAFVTGFLGDRYGRRFTYQFNLMIFGLASLAAAFAPNMEVLNVLRFVMGLGLGAEIVVTRRVEAIDPVDMTVRLDGGDVVRTRSIVLAMGVEWRRLEVDSVERFVGSGVYYGAARSDASLAQGCDVYLIGAGNSAGQAAIFFSNHARSVTLLVRGESLAESMSQYLIEQIATKANIRVETRSEVVAVHGDEQLEVIEVIDRRTGTTSRRDAKALFVLIGAEAQTDWLPSEIARDEHGFVLTGTDAMKAGPWKADREPFALETSTPGIFAVGDIRSGSVKRVASSVGEGGVAIALVHHYLQLSS